MRYVTIILLLLVCFFGGITYGTMEKKPSLHAEENKTEQWLQSEPYGEEQPQIEEAIVIQKEEAAVHRLAHFVENLVVSVYEFLIESLYAVAQLFF